MNPPGSYPVFAGKSLSNSGHLFGPRVSPDRKEESEPDEAKAPSSSGVLEPVHLTEEETYPPAIRRSYGVGEDDSGLVRAGVHLRRSWSQPLGEVLLLMSRPC